MNADVIFSRHSSKHCCVQTCNQHYCTHSVNIHFCKGLAVANFQFPNSDLRVLSPYAVSKLPAIHNLYINLRRSHDCLRSCVQSSVDSIHSVRFYAVHINALSI